MSLYSQNFYGQPAYTTPTFQSPGYHQQYQYPAPTHQSPMAIYHVDPIVFRRDYTNRLAELTVNSRPVIQSLSLLAQEYSRFAEIVAQCLESHIRRVPPWMKLPAFYLLDAISKNVYEPYSRHFAAFVIPLFLETYAQVDEQTRSKMEEMLLTWRTGSPTGKELFGVPPQVAIERGVWGDGGVQASVRNVWVVPSVPHPAPQSGFYSGSGQITKGQVLSELEFTLGQKERAVQSNPYDSASQNHINVLQQLRRLVEAGVSQDELQQILSQLRAMVRSPPVPPPAPAPPPVNIAPNPSLQWAQAYPPPSFSPPIRPYSQGSNSYQSNPPNPAKPEDTHTISSNPGPSAPPDNIASLLSTLVKAGVVSASGTTTAPETEVKPPSEVDLEKEAARAYRQSVLSHSVKLNSTDITRQRPPIVELLYDQLAAQCKQCGIRFADNAVGKKSMDNHLDMHFRQNRKANQNVGRGHSRSWFISVDDWIQDSALDIKGKGRADGVRPSNAKAAAAAEVAKRDAELRSLYVVVPPGDEAKPVACPICKETLKSEFMDDVEDWVWKNATKKDDRVYHATCHAEAVTSTSSLAARLRTETTGRSRSGTPEAQGKSGSNSRSTPPPSMVRQPMRESPSLSPLSESKLAGTKRKGEHHDSPNTPQGDGTPPLKKLALATTA